MSESLSAAASPPPPPHVYVLLDYGGGVADGRAPLLGVFATREAATAEMRRVAARRTANDPTSPYTAITDDPSLGDACEGVEDARGNVLAYLTVIAAPLLA